MKNRNVRLALCASTAFTFAAGLAYPHLAQAQTAPAPVQLDLGSVVSTGVGGFVAPSAVGGLAQAQQLKKLAPNIISVQPQSQIRKLPDVNVAEALGRIPGVSLEGDSGAGRYVNIRGLDADLNGTTYDGIKLPATNNATVSGGSRATAFDVFPAGIIGGNEVIKSLTPEIGAEGLGGEVNMLSPALPDNGSPILQISGGSGVESLRHTLVYDGSITYGQYFAIPGLSFTNPKPFSFIFTYAAHGDHRGIDDVEESYFSPTAGGAPASFSSLDLRRYQEHRNVQGFSGELDFDPDPQTNIFIRGIHSGYNEAIDKNILHFNGLDGTGTDAFGNPGTLTQNPDGSYTATGASAEKDYTNVNERIALDLLEFGGRTVIDNLVSVDARTSFAQGSDIFTRNFGAVFADQNPLTVNYNTADPAHRTFSAINEATGASENLADPNNYTYTGINNTPSRAFDQIFENAGDASIPTNYFGFDGELKAGVDVTLREKTFRQTELDGTPNSVPLSSVINGEGDITFYNDFYNIGPDVNNYAVFAVPTAYTVNQVSDLQAYQHDSEDVYAGYAEQTINIGLLTVLGGVRVEATDGTYGANKVLLDQNGNFLSSTPSVNRQNYTNVFPSLQLTYHVTPQFQVRGAYSTAIARPGFEQITAATVVDFSSPSVSTGNPALKPTTGNSFDLTAEYYTSHDGLLSADLFYKSFSNYIAQTTVNGPLTFPDGTVHQGVPFTSYENIGGAVAQGIELDGHQKFYSLPSPFDGLGIDANLTYVNSLAQIHPGLKKSVLPQTSPLTFNVAPFYEKGPLSLRVGIDYVSRNLFSVGQDPSTDVFSQPRLRLDIGASYNVTPKLQLYFDAKNLTNTKLEFTQSASTAYPTQREFYGQDFLFGFRMSLGS